MTTDERDARLTAYALSDPGLSAADRLEVEATLRTDPAARQALEETLKLAQLLTTGLAAEQAALPAEAPVAIPSSRGEQAEAKSGRWKMYAAAAAVMVAVLGGLYADLRRAQGSAIADARRTPAEHAAACTGS